jgi:membrane-bound ClpP family serine protease
MNIIPNIIVKVVSELVLMPFKRSEKQVELYSRSYTVFKVICRILIVLGLAMTILGGLNWAGSVMSGLSGDTGLVYFVCGIFLYGTTSLIYYIFK